MSQNFDRANTLPVGLYESLLTEAMAQRVAAIGDRATTGQLSPDEAPGMLAAHIESVLARVLASRQDPVWQMETVNRLLESLGTWVAGAVEPGERLAAPESLLSISEASGPYSSGAPVRPLTPLSQNNLLVHAHDEPSLASELDREIRSADDVDLICAFIVWNAVRLLRPALEDLVRRGGKIRVLTTTYTGITEARALEELVRLGAEVRVSYDLGSTRLHAKAWRFDRQSGFGTAYVGSSNMTHTALHDGLEWNVRLSQISSPNLIERFRAAFDTYWSSPEFERFDPVKFTEATSAARRPADWSLPFEIRPQPFQEVILERLQTERERHHRWRNLLVAATGTGKTVVSALDYARLRQMWGNPSLLFVAHRQEILQQSVKTFRAVLKDGNFGELHVGGARPRDGRHVFASVQSLAQVDLDNLPPDSYDVLVIDEFHHAGAPTYQRLLDHLRPRVLLGLTATPERMDGIDITRWFDGKIDFELRLWEALEQGLLVPFQYFGVSDDVDLSQLTWRSGGYDAAELAQLYVNHDLRTAKVIRELRDRVEDPLTMRALGFCVSIEHARYMARRFNEAGIPAIAITSATSAEDRSEGLRHLRERSINVIFAVDVFNEGLDVPEIDTVIFLRPTESATIFLQQMGRGLRRHPGKAGLTILDFIGQQHRQFKFAPIFTAISGVDRGALAHSVEMGFPYLPAGCSIQLDRVAAEVILNNIRQAVRESRVQFVQELKGYGDVTLAEYLARSGRSVTEVYGSGGRCWTDLRRRAGFPVAAEGPRELILMKALNRMLHIDDPDRLDAYSNLSKLLDNLDRLTVRQRRLLHMLHTDLWSRNYQASDLQDSMEELRRHPAIMDELQQLMEVLSDSAAILAPELSELDTEVPLRLHAEYTTQEVLAAFGVARAEAPVEFREGVKWLPEHKVDLLFVTLNKSDDRYSPTTMYKDFAESANVFHWESQSTTAAGSPTGDRYVQHAARGSQVLLFVREERESDGRTLAYTLAGPVRYLSHQGSRPMAIRWQLAHPLPMQFVQASRAAG